MQATFFLVGGFGFVGRNILEQIELDASLRETLQVHIIDDLRNACPGHKTVKGRVIETDYNDTSVPDFVQGMRKPDRPNVFIFLAGETRIAESMERPADFIQANIVAPSEFVISNVGPGDIFILVSTAGALFDGTSEIVQDSSYQPKNFYGATKAAEEMILEKLVEMRGGTFSVVRMTNVYGRFSDRKKSAIHAFTKALLNAETVTLNGDGLQTRDFVYAGDAGRAIANLAVDLCQGKEISKVNLIASGCSSSLLDVINTLEAVTGRTLAYVQDEAKALLATEPRDVVVAPSAITPALQHQITSLADGLERTYAYYRETGV